MREAAIAGHGMVILPTFIVSKAIQRGELEAILPESMGPPTLDLSIVYPSTRNVPAKVRLFIDFLVKRFGGTPFRDCPIFG